MSTVRKTAIVGMERDPERQRATVTAEREVVSEGGEVVTSVRFSAGDDSFELRLSFVDVCNMRALFETLQAEHADALVVLEAPKYVSDEAQDETTDAADAA